MDESRRQALSASLAQIQRQFGRGAIMRMGERGASVSNVEVIPTGSLALDVALGIGGLPKGRIVEIYGPESSGKTTLALEVVAECQKHGGAAVFIDAEHALDPTYAEKLGVDMQELVISQPDTGEQGLEIADMLVRSGAVDLIVIDSVAALTPPHRARGRDGGYAGRAASASDVESATQNYCKHRSIENLAHFHQSDSHENRCDVRQSRNDDRRQCVEVLRLGASGYPPHQRDQAWRRSDWQRDARESRKKQVGAAIQKSRV